MNIEQLNSKNYNQFLHPLYTENSIAFITLNITINSFIDFSVSNFYDLVDCGYIYRQHPVVLPCYVYARARSKQFGVIHKLCRIKISNFWPPPPLSRLSTKKNWQFWPPSSPLRRHSLWTAPSLKIDRVQLRGRSKTMLTRSRR